jgi:twitching motility protein PilT
MHTVNAPETVQRFIDLFGGERVALARQMLAGTLVGIASQRLVAGASGGRVLNAEVLVNSSRLRDLISSGESQDAMTRAIGAGDYYGMQTFDQDLLAHVRDGRVARDAAVASSTSPHDFTLLLAAAGVDGVGAAA